MYKVNAGINLTRNVTPIAKTVAVICLFATKHKTDARPTRDKRGTRTGARCATRMGGGAHSAESRIEVNSTATIVAALLPLQS